MSFVAGIVLLGWAWGWICYKMERVGGSASGGGGGYILMRWKGWGGVIVGVGICGRMVEIYMYSNFSLIRFCSSTTSRRTSFYIFDLFL